MPSERPLSPKEAIALQHKLKGRVRIAPLGKKIRTIAGADVSLNLYSKGIYAGIIVLSYPELAPLEYAVVNAETRFPYIPGLLSFREVPALLECWKKLKTKPDVVMLDGQGIAHPRHLGIASHFGVLTGAPTIGVAKSKLYGTAEGEDLVDPKSSELIGKLLATKPRSNPLIISPGHKVDLKQSLALVCACLRGYKLPEPTRLAHNLVNAFRRGEPLQEYGREGV